MQDAPVHKKNTAVPVMESFYTLQGEGFHQGKAAYFIRLGGCDVGCFWCDVKESWNAAKHPLQTKALHDAGFQTNIETSGSHPLSGTWDWICLSPKKFKEPLPSILPHTNELKVVIYNKSDFKWAETYAAQVAPQCKLYLQPEWDKRSEITPLIIDYIKANPKWELSLQIHKYINLP